MVAKLPARLPGPPETMHLGALALGLADSGQSHVQAVELLADTAGFRTGPIRQAGRLLAEHDLRPRLRAQALRLLDIAAVVSSVVAQQRVRLCEHVERLLADAEVFEEPGTYQAGVLDALRVVEAGPA